MGYYANGNGSIVFSRGLSVEEYDRISEILSRAFDTDGDPASTIKAIAGKGYFDIWCSDKYYEDEVIKALNDVNTIVPVDHGNIDYIGEDDCIWRFIWKNGRWNEQNGRVVYDDDFPADTFGRVSWHREDIITALDEQFNIMNPSQALVDDILTRCQNDNHFTDAMIEAGWDTLSFVINEAITANPEVLIRSALDGIGSAIGKED